jgi:hypothetical protein
LGIIFARKRGALIDVVLAIDTSPAIATNTGVSTDFGHALAAVGTRVVLTVVLLHRAVTAEPTRWALTKEGVDPILTGSAVAARIAGAVINVLSASRASIPRFAGTVERTNPIETSTAILTRIISTIVHIHAAGGPCVPAQTIAGVSVHHIRARRAKQTGF